MHTGTKYDEIGNIPLYIKNICTVQKGIKNFGRPKDILKAV
jgi:hypothetical protein